MHRWCRCIDQPQRVRGVIDEVVEFIQEPSLDELSDVLWGIGRLLGRICHCLYVPLPGQGKHIEKMDRRMAQWGCVRSARHPHCSG